MQAPKAHGQGAYCGQSTASEWFLIVYYPNMFTINALKMHYCIDWMIKAELIHKV